jgi:hypothetical protein
MDDRFNTIAGWVLGAGIVALGASIVTGEIFSKDRPEKMGYPIEGVEEEGAAAKDADQPIAFYLASPTRARARTSSRMLGLPQCRAGWGERARPQHSRDHGRPARGQARLCLFGRLEGQGRHLDLGRDGCLAEVAQELRAGHQDDLCRPVQAGGPRQSDGLDEPAGLQSAAAAPARRGRQSRRRPPPRRPTCRPAATRARTSRC